MPIQNAIRIIEDWPKVSYLVSRHTHDFRSHTFKDGTDIFVDGGKDYLRRGGSALRDYADKWTEFSIGDHEPEEYLKYKLLWGKRYDENGKLLPKVEWVLLRDCTTAHLEAILAYKYPPNKDIKGTIYERTILEILKERDTTEKDLTRNQVKSNLGKSSPRRKTKKRIQ